MSLLEPDTVFYDSPVRIVVTAVEQVQKQDEVVTFLVGRTINRIRHVIEVYGLLPFLYSACPTPWENLNAENLADKVLEIESVEIPALDGRTGLHKVIVQVPQSVPKLRKALHPVFEDDIRFQYRAWLEYGFKHTVEVTKSRMHYKELVNRDDFNIQVDPRIITYDIETNQNVGVKESINEQMKTFSKPIISIAAYDNYKGRYDVFIWRPEFTVEGGEHVKFTWQPRIPYKKHPELEKIVKTIYGDRLKDILGVIHKFATEFHMLDSFRRYLTKLKPDVVQDFNGAKFDRPYLIGRASLIGLGKVYRSISPLGQYSWDTATDPDTKIKFRTVTFKGLPFSDAMILFKQRTKMEGRFSGYSLEFLSQHLLKIGKVSHVGRNVGDMWADNWQEEIYYNIGDIENTMGVSAARSLIPYFDAMRKIIGSDIDMAWRDLASTDMSLFREVYGEYILPSKNTYSEQEVQEMLDKQVSKGQDDSGSVEGAVVFPASPCVGGVPWLFVTVLDLKALYPNTMISCNVCPSTYDPNGDILTAAGHRFTSTKVGIPSRLFKKFNILRDKMKNERDKYKQTLQDGAPNPDRNDDLYEAFDLQQSAFKGRVNTLYGVFNNPFFRLQNPIIGESCTLTSQLVIKFTAMVANGGKLAMKILAKLTIEGINRWFEEFKAGRIKDGVKILYGDTDSIFVQTVPEVTVEQYKKMSDDQKDSIIKKAVRISKEIKDRINKAYDLFAKMLNVKKHFWQLNFEKLYRTWIMADVKKRYFGIICWLEGSYVDKLQFKGIEVKRSNNSDLTREAQAKAFEMIARLVPYEQISDYVHSICQKLLAREYPLEYIAVYESPKKLYKTKKVKDAKGNSKDEFVLDEFGNRILLKHPRIRAMLNANRFLGLDLGPGDSFMLLPFARTPPGDYGNMKEIGFTDEKQLPSSFVNCFDYEGILEAGLKKKLEPIFSLMGWVFAHMKEGMIQEELW